jgi:hypothetical protein
MNRRPSWIWRSAVAVEVEIPKFEEPMICPGVAKVAWFITLKNSAPEL